MKINNLILQVVLVAIALLAGTVVSSPADNSVLKGTLFEGYSIEPLTYSGTVNGGQVNTTGTVEVRCPSPSSYSISNPPQQIFKELSAKDPNFGSQEPRSIETGLVTRAKVRHTLSIQRLQWSCKLTEDTIDMARMSPNPRQV